VLKAGQFALAGVVVGVLHSTMLPQPTQGTQGTLGTPGFRVYQEIPNLAR
jgi:hypothetical protein